MRIANNRLEELFERWYNNQSTPAEKKELADLLAAGDLDRTLTPLMKKAWERLQPELLYTEEQIDVLVASILKSSPAEAERNATPVHRVHFLKTSWFRYAAAVILLIGGAAIWYAQSVEKSVSSEKSVSKTTDIQPGTNRAILTVGNKKIDLATNKTGIAVGNVITYSDGERIADVGQLLQLTTPRGGQYQAVLPDGSKVWLNAASSIKFPSKFTGDKREVEIIGEAYLEIEKNSKQPFYVHTGKTDIQVLGTSFNVNAYEDEAAEKTTLIEGSVRISSFRRSEERATEIGSANTDTKINNYGVRKSPDLNTGVILKPGQQAQLINNQISIINNQSEAAIAWKNGLFNFNNADLKTIMTQLERWYNIDVQYEGELPQAKFQGKMDRGLTLSQVLKILSESEVNYRLEGKILIVSGK